MGELARGAEIVAHHCAEHVRDGTAWCGGCSAYRAPYPMYGWSPPWEAEKVRAALEKGDLSGAAAGAVKLAAALFASADRKAANRAQDARDCLRALKANLTAAEHGASAW